MKKLFFVLAGVFCLTACSDEVPTCGDSDAKETLLSLLDENDYKTIGFQSVEETAYNEQKDVRLCKAQIGTENGLEIVQYKLSWKNKKQGKFEVEVVF